MLEFVDSDLYFVQDKNNFINPLFQVGSGGPKITGSGSGSGSSSLAPPYVTDSSYFVSGKERNPVVPKLGSLSFLKISKR